MKKILLLFVLAIVTLASCRKDSDVFVANPTTPTVQLKASFKGIVVDQNENALENVEVKIGTVTTMTDAQGFFIINNQEVDKNKAFVQASREGFFSGSRTVIAQKNATHNVRIMLLSDESIGTIDNAVGGEVSLPNGSKVVFPVNGVAQVDGSAYTGTVYVSAKYIDPSTTNGQLSMPGDLRAINNESEVQALTSYGMIAVELKDDAGDLLQVAAQKTVELQVMIPAEGLATAANSIPLWYFDNEKASWIEDGSATKVGNMYVGAVRHFSFWNCDIPADYTTINMNFTDSDGNPIPGLSVTLSGDVPYSPGYGITNSAGYVGGIIPSGAVLTMTVTNNCGAVMMTQDIGPYTVESTENFVVNDLSVYPHITGTLVGCDGVTPVTNGYINFDYNYWWNNYSYEVDENGNFDFDYASCIVDDTTIATITGYDIDLLNHSDPQTFTLALNVDLGNVLTCIPVEQYFYITNSLGELHTNLNPYMSVGPDSLMTTELIYSLGFEDGSGYLSMYFNGIAADAITNVGTYTDVFAYASGSVTEINMDIGQSNVNLDVEITSFPNAVDEFLMGTGTMTVATSGEIFDISFKVKRQ